MNLKQIVDYYQDLLIIQYHHKPKARAVIALLIQEVADNAKILEDIRDAYNIDNAKGVQLDVVAKYFGIKREWAGIDFDKGYFDFKYIDPTFEQKVVYRHGVGYQTVKRRGDGYFQTLLDVKKPSYSLTDEELRAFIKLRMIALANEKITYKYFYDEMFRLFGLTIIPVVNDNGSNMHIDFYFDPTLTHLASVLMTYPEFLPTPAGVGVNVYSVLPDDPKFFTLKVLTADKSKKYNRFQGGLNVIGNTKKVKLKTLE